MKQQTLTLMKADMKVYLFIKRPQGINLSNNAQMILKEIEKNGAMTRPALVAAMDEKIETEQFVATVVGHWTYVLAKHGLIKIMKLDEYMARQQSAGVKEPDVSIVPNDRGGWSIKVGDQMLGNYGTESDARKTMVSSCLNEKK